MRVEFAASSVFLEPVVAECSQRSLEEQNKTLFVAADRTMQRLAAECINK